jgi:hypothetical protein
MTLADQRLTQRKTTANEIAMMIIVERGRRVVFSAITISVKAIRTPPSVTQG